MLYRRPLPFTWHWGLGGSRGGRRQHEINVRLFISWTIINRQLTIVTKPHFASFMMPTTGYPYEHFIIRILFHIRISVLIPSWRHDNVHAVFGMMTTGTMIRRLSHWHNNIVGDNLDVVGMLARWWPRRQHNDVVGTYVNIHKCKKDRRNFF